jgi:hypothetical protein
MKTPQINFKMPSFGKRKGRNAINGSGDVLKPPKVLADLYADLRDRRLLPLVALLIIGMIAAPILLSSKGEEEGVPVAPPVAEAEASASQASFQVVPAEPGLRAPGKRLGYRQARDPFKQPVAAEANEAESAGESAPEGSEAPTTTETSSVVEASSSEPVVITKNTTKTETETVVQNNVVDYTVDVDAGYLSDQKAELKELSQQPAYTELPNEKHPVVVYMGLSPDHKRALFLMGNQVVAYYGAGKCTLEQESCQLIELKPGQSETFAYGLEEKPFKLTLKKINEVVEKQKASASKTEHSEGGADGKEADKKPGSGSEASK